MKKKTLSIFMVLTLVITLLSSCAGGNEKAKSDEKKEKTDKIVEQTKEENKEEVKKEEILIWHSADATISQTIEDELNSKLENVHVTMERKDNMSEALKMVGNDPDNAPDMYFWAHDKVGVFAQIGLLEPVTNILSKEDMKDMLPMTVEAGVYDGEDYQVPLYYENLLFMYNKDLMSEVPETMDDLLSKMEKETTNDLYIFVEQHSTSYVSAAWIQGYGGYIINKDRKAGLNLPDTEEALEYQKKFIPFMPADGEYNTVTTLFAESKAASTIGGPWLVPDIKKAGIDLGIAPMPKLPNGEPLKPFSGVQGFSVLKHAAENKKEVCASVLKGLMSEELGLKLAEIANCAPANSKCYENETIKSNEMIMTLKEMSNSVIPMPNVPEMDVMWGVTDSLLADINKQDADVVTACDKYQKMAEEAIAAMQ